MELLEAIGLALVAAILGFYRCPYKEQVHLVEAKYGGYKGKSYGFQKFQNKGAPRKPDGPRNALQDKLNAFLDAQAQPQEDETEEVVLNY